MRGEKFFEQLNKLKSETKLDSGQKEAIKGRLIQFMTASEDVRESAQARHDTQRSIMGKYFKPMQKIASVIAAVALLGAGTSFAAEKSLPGDFLHFVKVNVNEKIASAFAISTKAKADLETELAARRLEEASHLSARNEGKIDAQTKADLEANFQAHADRAQDKIRELEISGDVRAAAEAASRLESTLKANGKILGGLESKLESESKHEAATEIKPLEVKVDEILEAAAAARSRLESNVASEDAEANVSAEAKTEAKVAAEGKVKAAKNVIAEVRQFIERNKDELSAKVVADAAAELKMAEDLTVQAKAKIDSGAFGEAFNIANRSIRTAQEAKAALKAEAEFKVDIGIGNTESNIKDNNEREIKAESKPGKGKTEVDIKPSPNSSASGEGSVGGDAGANSSADINGSGSAGANASVNAGSGTQTQTGGSGGVNVNLGL